MRKEARAKGSATSKDGKRHDRSLRTTKRTVQCKPRTLTPGARGCMVVMARGAPDAVKMLRVPVRREKRNHQRVVLDILAARRLKAESPALTYQEHLRQKRGAPAVGPLHLLVLQPRV